MYINSDRVWPFGRLYLKIQENLYVSLSQMYSGLHIYTLLYCQILIFLHCSP